VTLSTPYSDEKAGGRRSGENWSLNDGQIPNPSARL
jgi:hypothetical protein